MSAYPPFPGTEAHFLRAQLARIAASTVLCPAGYFTANEEGGLDKAEDFTPPAPTDLGTAGAWAHRYPHLKKQGRLLLAREVSCLRLCSSSCCLLYNGRIIHTLKGQRLPQTIHVAGTVRGLLSLNEGCDQRQLICFPLFHLIILCRHACMHCSAQMQKLACTSA